MIPNWKKYLKFILPILFALGMLLGFLQKSNYPFQNKKLNFRNRTELPEANSEFAYFYNKAQSLAQKDTQTSNVNFLAVGDIMLSRNVLATMDKAQDSYLPYRGMADILKSTDFNFGNLESPFHPKNCYGISGGHSMIFGAPCQSTEAFNEYNFKVLNLANNHAMDQGLEGIKITKNFLENAGIKTLGAGENLEQAWQPKIVEANGIKIGFVGASYASANDNGKTKNNYVARMEDLENLKSAIFNLKSQSDFVVVTMHAGTEYTRKPNQNQIDFAKNAIDFGADLVIGAHPHWIQTVEKYRNKYIFYSLGNFIFDQEWSQETKEGLTLKIQISNFKNQNGLQGPKVPAKLESIELIPVVIENYSTPRVANKIETKKILKKIHLESNFLY